MDTGLEEAPLLTRKGLDGHGDEGLCKDVDGLPLASARRGAAVAAHAALQHLAEAGPARRQPLGLTPGFCTLLQQCRW